MTETSAAALVEEVCDLGGTTSDRLIHVPDVAASVVFRTTSAGRSDLRVVGPRTRAAYFAGKDLPVCVKVRLPPAAARLVLGVPLQELADRGAPLAGLWGEQALRLARRLAALDGDGDRIAAHLEEAFQARVRERSARQRTHARLVATATAALSAPQPMRLPDLARRLAVSERHLRNLLTTGTGLTPMSFVRVTRLRTALAAGQVGAAPLAQIAAATGYYDQSHMTTEFGRMMGVPPAAFFAGRLPAVQPC